MAVRWSLKMHFYPVCCLDYSQSVVFSSWLDVDATIPVIDFFGGSLPHGSLRVRLSCSIFEVKQYHRPDCNAFDVFGRVLSGTVFRGDRVKILGADPGGWVQEGG